MPENMDQNNFEHGHFSRCVDRVKLVQPCSASEWLLALIHTAFHVVTAFGLEKTGTQKITKVFFQHKFSSLKAQARYFTVFIHFAT